jgi:hypothetical protein
VLSLFIFFFFFFGVSFSAHLSRVRSDACGRNGLDGDDNGDYKPWTSLGGYWEFSWYICIRFVAAGSLVLYDHPMLLE